jgi:hypothetical protein
MLGKYAGQKKGLSHSQRMMRTLNLSRRCVNFESSFQDCEALVRLVIEVRSVTTALVCRSAVTH